MSDGLVDREPEVARVEDEVVAPHLHRLRRQLLHGDRRPPLGVVRHAEPRDVLPSGPARRELLGVALEVAVADRRGREARAHAIERLRRERPVGGGQRLLLAQELEARVDEADALHLECRFVGAEEERDLVLDRDLERVDLDRRLPLADHRLHRRELHGAPAGDLRRARDARRLARGELHGVARELARGGEAPRAIDERPHADAVRLGVAHVGDLPLAREDRLTTVASDAGVGVRGAGVARRLERFHEQLLDGRVDARRAQSRGVVLRRARERGARGAGDERRRARRLEEITA